MKKIFLLIAVASSTTVSFATNNDSLLHKKNVELKAVSLKLPIGFSANIVSENIGRARHLAVLPNGDMYIKLSKLQDGKGIVKINKNASTSSFANFSGTGIAIKKGYLYATSDEEVFRYKLNDNGEVMDANAPEKIVTGLLSRRQHESKSIALDNDGNIYVNIGAYSNSCQEKDRTKGSKGMLPCPILDSAGGIWKFRADKQNQTYAEGIRYATGLRNIVGLDWNTQTNSLFVMQHGRDQLFQSWPEYYTEKSGAELPSECMYELHEGSNCGWPFTYYNHEKNEIMVAPEYGGDGNKTLVDYVKENSNTGISSTVKKQFTLINDVNGNKPLAKKATDKFIQKPVVAFPGHMAPNGLLFYTGNQFPERYKNGAFIAFHGSWNRAPLPQAGYFVVFQPFKNGKPFGNWEIFADGFSEKDQVNSPREAVHRPCGLAQGADGSLYVTDDNKGFVYKIGYSK